MNHSKLCMRAFVCALMVGSVGTHTQAQESCDFSKLKARHVADFIERMAINRAVPTYPDEAKAKGIAGEIQVAILINKNGQVERACPLIPARTNPPDASLIVAAKAAALEWTFPRNFGFPENQRIRFDYVKGILRFQFLPGGWPSVTPH